MTLGLVTAPHVPGRLSVSHPVGPGDGLRCLEAPLRLRELSPLQRQAPSAKRDLVAFQRGLACDRPLRTRQVDRRVVRQPLRLYRAVIVLAPRDFAPDVATYVQAATHPEAPGVSDEMSIGQDLLRPAESEATGLSDAALARGIAGGSAADWEAFFARFAPWAYRFAYHHLDRSHADAEDLCSEILTAAAKGIQGYDPARGSLDLWMLGLARHCLSRFCRGRRKRPPAASGALPVDTAGQGTGQGPLAEGVLTRDAVNRAIAALPERQAMALVGKYVHGYSTQELAYLVGTTPKAVESLLDRGRTSLRAALGTVDGGADDE